ncbi:MAG: hypothetical protein AB2L12_05635 [Smithellaceae bacterium]
MRLERRSALFLFSFPPDAGARKAKNVFQNSQSQALSGQVFALPAELIGAVRRLDNQKLMINLSPQQLLIYKII